MAKFVIQGEHLTEQVRNLWYQGDYKTALQTLSETVPDMNRGHQMDLIDYKMKLTGKNNLDFVEETEKSPSDYPKFEDVMGFAQNSQKVIDQRRTEDRSTGLRIIEYFEDREHWYGGYVNSYTDSAGMTSPYKWACMWFTLLPEVQFELRDRIPFYMAMWLRERAKVETRWFLQKYDNGDKSCKDRVGIWGTSNAKNIISCLPISLDREVFTTRKGRDVYDRLCDDIFIFGEQRDIIYDEFRYLWDKYSIENVRKNANKTEPEEKREPLKRTKASVDCQFAWISPDGWLYPCAYIQHGRTAYRLLTEELEIECTHTNAEMILEKQKWFKIHVNDEDPGTTLYSGLGQPTTQQQKRIAEHAKYHENKNPWEKFTS